MRPREGVCGGVKYLAPPTTASAQCLRLSERFFSFPQCFGVVAVGWVTGRASDRSKILHQQSLEVLLWENFGGPDLTGSNL